jgi:hypothetical protein
MRLRTNPFAIFCLATICACAISCADPVAWELKGEVRFIELRETVDGEGAKKGSLDYSIRNTGSSKIEGSSFAFTYSTSKSKYHFTVVDDSAIKGGALVYGHVSIGYAEADEVGKLEDAIIDCVQFK